MPKPNRHSKTAEAVLAGVWLTACDPATRQLADPETARYSRSALRALHSPLAWLLKFGFVRWLARRREARVLPGICGHWAARKAAIYRLAEEIEPDALVVFGAGLDGLAYRVADQVNAYEVDWPASQARKKQILAKLPPRQITLIEADLSDPSYLSNLPHGAQTLFVAEGLLMYLPEAQVRSLLSQLSGQGTSIVFTFMDLNVLGRPAFSGDDNKVQHYLKQMSEPFLWGLDRAGIAEFAESVGWSLLRTFGAPDDRQPKLEIVPGMIPGEWIAYATSNQT